MNYQLVLEDTLKNLKPGATLLLHVCCAPCSSYVLEYLSNYFEITVFYYNPNIDTLYEYNKRVREVKRFIEKFPTKYPVHLVEFGHQQEKWDQAIIGMGDEKEGGKRCFACYELRLNEAFLYAKEHHYDYITTTLTISPLKNSQKINEIGKKLEEQYHVNYLYSDFKKKEGYKRSIVLSHEYNLYRQNYCGCRYSKKRLENEQKLLKNTY